MKSIIQNKKECYVCSTTYNIHEHHIFFGTANRKLSEEDGLKVYLCAKHHNMSDEGVHYNRELDLKLKQIAEKKWIEKNNSSIEEFIKKYGKNYIGGKNEN